jgi:Zn-dependent peptidase ImmA (M78 family)/DNA-binding transcriptional regulator YiaG
LRWEKDVSDKPPKVSANPETLRWARESAGYSVAEVSKKLRLVENTISKWESGEREPDIRKLEKLADVYKRPLAVFLLPQPPVDHPLPNDFRTLPEESKLPMSSKTRMAIRKARRFQTVSTELKKELDPEIAGLPRLDLSSNPEKGASALRKGFDIDIEQQFKWADSTAAFREWRKALEGKNILVFQMSMPVEEARGFSLLDGGYPVIVVNKADAINARIFTLFHEYCHLLLHHDGICLPSEISEGKGRAEVFCNHFSGSFLVPRESFEKELAPYSEVDGFALGALARKYKVSKVVIANRLRILGHIKLGDYRELMTTLEPVEPVPDVGRRPLFRSSPERQCLQEKGRKFVGLVLEAKNRELITYNDVSDLLSLKLNYLDKLEVLVAK